MNDPGYSTSTTQAPITTTQAPVTTTQAPITTTTTTSAPPVVLNPCDVTDIMIMDYALGVPVAKDLSDAHFVGRLNAEDVDSDVIYTFTGEPGSQYAMAVQLEAQSNPSDDVMEGSYKVIFRGPGDSHGEGSAPYVLYGDPNSFNIDECEIQTYTIETKNLSSGNVCNSVQFKIQVQSAGGVCDGIGDNKVVRILYNDLFCCCCCCLYFICSFEILNFNTI